MAAFPSAVTRDAWLWAAGGLISGVVAVAVVTAINPRVGLATAALWVFGVLALSVILAALVLALMDIRSRRLEVEGLAELGREKDELVAAVSHELRTPLTSVIGFAHTLRDAGDTLSGAEQEEIVGYIIDEAEAMEGIVEDLLLTARLERGDTVYVNPVTVDDVAEVVLQLIERTAVLRAESVSIDGTAAVLADPARLRQIMRNLLLNAVTHGAPPVEVTIRSNGDRVGMVVRDKGEGIAPAREEAMFDRRRAQADKRWEHSTGVGLWLSRELAQRMDGDLRYIGDSEGAAFELTLPAPGEG
jgi:signal transduction histidine kinase